MKSPEEALEQVADRLRRSWAQVLAGESWAHEFRLGTSGLTGRRLAEAWPDVHRSALRWQEWVGTAGDGITLATRPATVHGTQQPLPATLFIATIDDAARLAGSDWVARLARARQRLATLQEQFPGLADPASLLRATDAYGDVDFELACRAGAWFAAHPAHGLTARQVPVEGMGTKWLASHGAAVRRLAGLDDLGLERGRPARVHLTYLDPDHVDGGGRRHDVATVGDSHAIAYEPTVVLISENRDTAQLFPPVRGGIAVEGDGTGPGAVPSLAWVRSADVRLYWGDMDATGLEILHGYRAAGLDVRSLFMDLAAYQRWQRYGVDHDHAGNPIACRTPRDLPELRPGERELYLALCSEEWTGHRRIEQERIPLDEAAAVVRAATA